MSWPLAVTQNHSMSTYEEMVLKNLLMMMSRITPATFFMLQSTKKEEMGLITVVLFV